MKILKTIRDKDIGLDFKDPSVYQERKAARAIIFNKDNNIVLLHVTNKKYHKLPGGGVEEDEDNIEALKREAMEEVGCKIAKIRELGIIEEFRNKISEHQLSYCFIANLDGEKGTPNLEEDEIADGFKSVWLNLDTAIETLESETNIENYLGKFIREREIFFFSKKSRKLFKFYEFPCSKN